MNDTMIARYQHGGRHERRGWARDVTPAGRTAAVEDARLLMVFRRPGRLRSLFPRLIFVALGYAAITSLAAAYAEAVPLPVTASLVVIPAVVCVVITGLRNPLWGRRALVGWLAGIVATIIYDALRLALVQVGIWGDPIPTIGRLALADPHANFVWGYLWRFMGNGGGMGMAFAMLPWRGVRSGVVYGTMICSGLFALLFFAPQAQTHFFPLTPVTAAGAMAGHWVYGAVLGWLTWWWLPPVTLRRVRGGWWPDYGTQARLPRRTQSASPKRRPLETHVPPHSSCTGRGCRRILVCKVPAGISDCRFFPRGREGKGSGPRHSAGLSSLSSW